MPRVERGYRSERVGCDQSRLLLTRNASDDSSPGIDGGRDPGVGGAEQPAVVFDGAHAGLVQVLRVGATVAVPSVIGNVDEDLRALIGELADFVGEDGFVTDENAELFAAGIEGLARHSMSEFADFLGEASSECEQTWIG